MTVKPSTHELPENWKPVENRSGPKSIKKNTVKPVLKAVGQGLEPVTTQVVENTEEVATDPGISKTSTSKERQQLAAAET